MKLKHSLLVTAIVKPFYRENAGLLCFVYFIMFLAVGRANGVGLIEYHYALIQGMMNQTSFFLVVLAGWVCYAIKCLQFVIRTLRKPEFSWLYLLSTIATGRLYLFFLQVQLMLFFPVLSYVVIILLVGTYQQWYLPSVIVLLSNIITCVLAAYRYVFLVSHPGMMPSPVRWPFPNFLQRKYYFSFLFRFIMNEGKVLFVVTKIFSCGVLYFLLEGRNPSRETELRMVTLFYCFGLFGHGVIVHRLKQLENTRLTFYRTLPMALSARFTEYCIFYLALFLPEVVTIFSRMPYFLTVYEAGFFLLMGFSVLLLLNSLQLFNYTGLRDYFKTLLQVFIVFLMALISKTQLEYVTIVLVLAIVLFFTRYYRFEPQPDNVLR